MKTFYCCIQMLHYTDMNSNTACYFGGSSSQKTNRAREKKIAEGQS